MTQTFDLLIIGGGAHGASLAFHLSARGVKVAVLEKSFIASGATGRSSGLVRMHYDLEAEARLAWESFQWFRDWKERVGPDPCGFTRTGFLQLVKREHVDALKANTHMLQRIGVPTMLVTAEDVKRLAPFLVTDDFDLAAYEPESGYADPVSTATSMMNAARARGAVFVQDCQVTGIRLKSGRVEGVDTSKGPYSAPIVVNAAGAWARQICALAGVDVPLGTWRHDVMFATRPPELRLPHPTVIDFPNSMYFRPEGGLTLVGLEDGNPLDEDPDGDSDHARAGFVDRAIDRLCRRVPLMERGGLHSAHGGYDGITPDQHPALGPIGPEGFWLDCGFSGTGFKISPAVGLCMSEWILDGAPKTVDISIFTPTRFVDGKHLVSEHPYESIWR
ncbi:MAG: FAD-binding oxidoreductase [Anaerolineaceae bacterium]|nr:MAG: FAD-binding oxidoreductase [Anaerolineaceae bacterium]